jgi:hypothetical protein
LPGEQSRRLDLPQHRRQTVAEERVGDLLPFLVGLSGEPQQPVGVLEHDHGVHALGIEHCDRIGCNSQHLVRRPLERHTLGALTDLLRDARKLGVPPRRTRVPRRKASRG